MNMWFFKQIRISKLLVFLNWRLRFVPVWFFLLQIQIFMYLKYAWSKRHISISPEKNVFKWKIFYKHGNCSMVQFSSVAQLCPTLWPHRLQHTRPPCPSPTPGAYSNSRPSNWWCHPTISSSVIPFSSCLQSFPASGSFPISQFFASGGQSIGASASASVLPMNIQGWFPLG